MGDDDRTEEATVVPGSQDDGAVAGAVEDDEKWPFGFILTIVMVSIYLAYRLIQGVVLFVDWIF